MKRKILFLAMCLARGDVAEGKPSVLPSIPPIEKVASNSLGARLKRFLGFKPKAAPQQAVKMRKKVTVESISGPTPTDYFDKPSRPQSLPETPSASSRRNTIVKQPVSPGSVVEKVAESVAESAPLQPAGAYSEAAAQGGVNAGSLQAAAGRLKKITVPERPKFLVEEVPGAKKEGSQTVAASASAQPQTTFLDQIKAGKKLKSAKTSRAEAEEESSTDEPTSLKKVQEPEAPLKQVVDSRNALLDAIRNQNGPKLRKVTKEESKPDDQEKGNLIVNEDSSTSTIGSSQNNAANSFAKKLGLDKNPNDSDGDNADWFDASQENM